MVWILAVRKALTTAEREDLVELRRRDRVLRIVSEVL